MGAETEKGGEDIILVKPRGRIERIGVLSDTHIPARARCLPAELFERLQGVDLILHAGDLVDESVLLELAALAPVEAVAGNMDPPHLQELLGRKKLLQLGGLQIGMIHGDGWRGTVLQRARDAFEEIKPQAIVFGHSHQPLCRRFGGTLLFNPGSPVDPRRARRPSYGLLELSRDGITGEIVHF